MATPKHLQTVFMALGIRMGVAAQGQTFDHFGGAGSSHWGELHDSWSACNRDTTQSPFNARVVQRSVR